ncbi:MAG TPA: RES family NAD+ phosphorylase [Gaiellaceae bacterium]|jgi:RES domain-containing protein|nr:RES family NAD+ phosphorylase [Gaiellaceae bacterium]
MWRLTRQKHAALDGAGTLVHGGRYSPPGVPVVNFASEAGLAVLVALRYLQGDFVEAPDDYVLGWTDIDVSPERVPDVDGDDAIRDWVTDWLDERRSLLAAVRSQVLPEADVVLMNPRHPDAASVLPLVTRPFSFAECLHTPPMLARYAGDTDVPAWPAWVGVHCAALAHATALSLGPLSSLCCKLQAHPVLCDLQHLLRRHSDTLA